MDQQYQDTPENGGVHENGTDQAGDFAEVYQGEMGSGHMGQPDFNQTVFETKEPAQPKKNNMALASMIMGIVGIVGSCCCLGTPFGALAILFACLSKTEPTMDSKAKAGLIMGIIGIVLTVVLLIFILVTGAANGIEDSLYGVVRTVTQVRYLA